MNGDVDENFTDKTHLRIVNDGQKAVDGQFPYQVAIVSYESIICGGALISNLHVLTAAHCITVPLKLNFLESLTVRVGAVKALNGNEYRIKRISHHKDYDFDGDKKSNAHDIAVIQVP